MRLYTLLLIILFLIPISANCQETRSKKSKKIEVSGYIKGPDGSPRPGVSIYLDNKQSNSVSDSKGHYKVKVKPGVKMISAFTLFEGIHEVEFTGQTIQNFNLGQTLESGITESENKETVNTGYQNVDKDILGTSVSSVNLDKTNSTRYSNIYQMIKGEVPGVVVSGTKITIRGGSSLTQNTEPLYVLDGMVVSQISDIPPEIVKSIEVLKGTAAAIYGSRGTDGVILIKTK